MTMEFFDEYWEGKPVAQVKVFAVTSNAAKAKGLKELQSTLDVINFFSDIIGTTGNGGRIYLPGDSSQGNALSMSHKFSDNGNCIATNVQHYMVGAKSAFLLSKETAKQLKKFGFQNASNLLKKTEKTDWDNRILSALQWAGRATSNRIINERISEETGVRREESFLLYAVALESLLLKKSSEVTYKFSTRGAHLISSNLQGRKKTRDRLVELYALRSSIVHSGLTKISHSDLDDMATLARTGVVRVLMNKKLREFEKWAQFDEWLEDKMLL